MLPPALGSAIVLAAKMPKSSQPSDAEAAEFSAWCRRLLNSPEYRQRLEIKMIEGTLTEGEQNRLHLFGFPKPAQAVDVRYPDNPFVKTPDAELAMRAEKVAERLREKAKQAKKSSATVH